MKVLASLACALLLATPAFAEKPSKESVDHLLRAADAEKSLVNMQKQIDTQMRAAMAAVLKKQNAGADAKEATEIFAKKMTGMLKEDLAWAKMGDLYHKAYTETFSQEEIDGLITFYESPLGHAFLEKMPAIAQKSSTQMQQRMAPLIQRLQQAMQEALQDVQKKKKTGPTEASRKVTTGTARRG